MGKLKGGFQVLKAGGYVGHEPPKKENAMHLKDCTNCPHSIECHHVEPLLPPGVERTEEPTIDVEAWERSRLVVPMEVQILARQQKSAKAKKADEGGGKSGVVAPMLPPSFGRR
jgi:hypothetical protein